ncbi:translation elongation factor EF-1alpha (GTPase) HBS1 [Tachypleus tridentatus]|uniref:translation elongation factor EF-1alpha (GTPase) HBS1 n=1 Tax=Tachypleus tridentatus TaxID=6853 RepID=UPI003FD670A5
MSRHRNVRSMNYDEEYEGYYDVYGHSVEDDYCISPSTEAEFLFDRTAQKHSISAYFSSPTGETLPEEEEEEEYGSFSSSQMNVSTSHLNLNQAKQEQLNSCVEEMQSVVGETVSESTLRTAALEHNFNIEKALDAVLNANGFSTSSTQPKPQRNWHECRYRQGVYLEKNLVPEKSENVNVVGNSVSEHTFETCEEPTAVGTEGDRYRSRIEENVTKKEKDNARLKYDQSVRKSISPTRDCSLTPSKKSSSPEANSSQLVEKSRHIENCGVVVEAVTSKPSGKSKAVERDPEAEYMKERGQSKPLINLVVIGHVDAGKSTLMGHLLYKLGHVAKKAMHKFEQDSKKLGKASFMYAWVLDETEEERYRGITMDVAQAKFETPARFVTLLDAPGHKDFIPNMISGASQADVAILVVDATRGEFETGFETGGQTREHTLLIRSLGVSQLAVAINKLDNVNWSQDRYNFIKTKLGGFLKQAGFRETDVTYVPCSGLTGENLIEPAKQDKLAAWYKGPCLVEVIDRFKPPQRSVSKPLRICVNDVFKGVSSGFCVAGKVEAGHLKNGDKVLVMPAGEPAVIKGVAVDDFPVTQAFAGDHVVVTMSGIDINNVTVGSVLCDPNQPAKATSRFQARVVIFNIKIPITKGFPVILHYQNLVEQAIIRKLISQLHRNTGEVMKNKPRCLTQNSNGVVEIEVNRPIYVELYKDFRELGRFMLRSGGSTIAAGLVTEIL